MMMMGLTVMIMAVICKLVGILLQTKLTEPPNHRDNHGDNQDDDNDDEFEVDGDVYDY